MDTYLPDAPLTDPKVDLFRRWPFAQRIAHTISKRSDPSSIVIGIYGNWGEGKTTILNFLEAELKKDESVVCVRFNPWLFSTQAQLILSFFQTLADALDKSLHTQKEKIGDFLSKYGALIAPISITPVPSVEVSPGEGLKDLGKELASTTLDVLKERIESILKEEKKRVVVLIDDIDRLDKEEIYSIFKLVKLTADFNYTAYVLAFDFEMVARALSERYAGTPTDAGTNFLEKIIQVPLILPKADEVALRLLCFRGAEQALDDAEIQLTENQGQEYARHFVDGLDIRLTTPRMAKRYTNALSFALPILKGEVNPVDLMLIEGIRVFYPQAYDFVRRNPDMFHGAFNSGVNNQREVQRIQESLNKMLTAYAADEAAALRGLLESLFPKLKAVFGNNYYGSEWQVGWSNEQRVCSRDYFARYFSYSISEGDVPDTMIDQFWRQMQTLDYQQTATAFVDITTPKNADRVLMKLRRKETRLSATDSEILSKAVAISGSIIPQSQQVFSFGGAFTQAAILVSQLLRNTPEGATRLNLAKELVSIAQPLPFAAEISRWLRSSKKETETERLFDQADEDVISRIVADRIRLEADNADLYIVYKDNSPFLYGMWARWIGPEEIAKHLERSFQSDKNVLKFLETYLGTTMAIESGLAGKGDFERGEYDAVVSLVDPEIILKSLVEIFGEEIEDAKSTYDYIGAPLDRRVAFQFAAMHKLVKNEAKPKPESSAGDAPEASQPTAS